MNDRNPTTEITSPTNEKESNTPRPLWARSAKGDLRVRTSVFAGGQEAQTKLN